MAEPFAPYAGIEGAALTGGEGGDLLQKLLMAALHGTAQIPQHVIDAAAKTAPPGLRREDYTDIPPPQAGSAPFGMAPMAWQPGDEMRRAALEAAMLPMGTGAIAGVPMRGAEAVLGAGPIRAYHGSPHSFDRFDLSKIGTGEGAQAYGHGLYFAESEGVAKSYRDALASKQNTMVGTDPLQNPGFNAGAVRQAYYTLTGNGGDIERAIKSAGSAMNANEVRAVLNNWKTKGVTTDPGKMYEVNINADPAHFLDWDKPLHQQTEAVKEILGIRPVTGPFDLKSDVARFSFNRNATGGDLYKKIGMGSDPYALEIEAKAAKRLAEAGSPGIKYLDQGSRDLGQGSSNYVVFNDKLIDIMRKYGLAGAAPVGALMSSAPSPDGRM